jgi:hypothetical protein
MPQPREAPKPGVVEAGLSEAFGVLGRSVTAGLRGSDKGRRGSLEKFSGLFQA